MSSPIQNPIPGTTRAKNNGGYDADSGLDISVPVGTPVYAVADGEIVYSEYGHTPWVNPPDTPYSILLRLAAPFQYKGHGVNYAWYTHMSRLAHDVPDGTTPKKVKRGALLGYSGTGNKVPHLHLGLIEDRQQNRTMPHPLIAELIWDQKGESASPDGKPPEGGALPEVLNVRCWAHDGKSQVTVNGVPYRLATVTDAPGHGAELELKRVAP